MTTQEDSSLAGLFLVPGQSQFAQMWRNTIIRPIMTRMQTPGIGPSEKFAMRQFIDDLVAIEPQLEDEFNTWSQMDVIANSGLGQQQLLTGWLRTRWHTLATEQAGLDASLVDNLMINDFGPAIDAVLDVVTAQASVIDARNEQFEEEFNNYVGAFENMASNPSLDEDAQKEARLIAIALQNGRQNLTNQYRFNLMTPEGLLSPNALSSGDFLNAFLPNVIRSGALGTAMQAEVVQGNAGASVSAIMAGIEARRVERAVVVQKQEQTRIDTTIKEMKRLYPEIADVVDSVFGDPAALKAEADSMGISMEDLIEQKTQMIGRVGEQDRQLKLEGYDVEFRRRLAEIESQAGEDAEELQGELKSLETAHSAELRRAMFESEQERTGIVNRATLAERDLTIKAREDMRRADERYVQSLESLSAEEEAAVKQAISGIGPGGLRREREAEVRKRFAERQKEMAKSFEKDRATLERDLDLALRESEVRSKGELSIAEQKAFESTEAKRSEFENKATAIEKSLLARLKALKEKEEEARRKHEEQKVADLQNQINNVLNTIKENEAKLRKEREEAEKKAQEATKKTADDAKKAAEEAAKKGSISTKAPGQVQAEVDAKNKALAQAQQSQTQPAAPASGPATHNPDGSLTDFGKMQGAQPNQPTAPKDAPFVGSGTPPPPPADFRPGAPQQATPAATVTPVPVASPIAGPAVLTPQGQLTDFGRATSTPAPVPPTPVAPAPVPTANPFEQALRAAGVPEDRIKILTGSA